MQDKTTTTKNLDEQFKQSLKKKQSLVSINPEKWIGSEYGTIGWIYNNKIHCLPISFSYNPNPNEPALFVFAYNNTCPHGAQSNAFIYPDRQGCYFAIPQAEFCPKYYDYMDYHETLMKLRHHLHNEGLVSLFRHYKNPLIKDLTSGIHESSLKDIYLKEITHIQDNASEGDQIKKMMQRFHCKELY